MEFSTDYVDRQTEIAALFAATFTASEGDEEGALIGDLARRLMADTPQEDLRVFTALDGEVVIGSIIFSRLTYEHDARSVFVLGPVAVATDHQGQGIGQQLIKHGIDGLRREGVHIVLTYGDPSFYGRVGFAPIDEADVAAPYKLQYPEGWLGQSLTGTALTTIAGASRCVAAFNDPAFW